MDKDKLPYEVELQRISDICQCIIMGNKGMNLCIGCDEHTMNMCNYLLGYAKDNIGEGGKA